MPQGTVEDSNLAAARDAGTAVDASENATAQAPEGREDDGAPRAPRERRSRDRYGRDRRERAPRDETEAGQDNPATAEPVTPSASAQDEAVYEPPVRSSYFNLPTEAAPSATTSSTEQAAADRPSAPQAPATSDTPRQAVAEEVVAPPVERREAEKAIAPAATPAPVATSLPAVPAFELSIETLQQVAQSSGLEWVNSNPEKVAQVQAAIAAEPKSIHAPREPRPVVVLDEGPLVLVETRKDLRNMTLPFENN
jgi:ribonuclease E